MIGNFCFLSLALAILFVFLAEGRGIDLGICGTTNVHCQCGQTNGYTIVIPVKACTYFYKFKSYCKPCDEIKDDIRCEPFRHCQECDVSTMRCSLCPRHQFGSRCNLNCTCLNGGICEQNFGNCICPHPFYGHQCEFTKTEIIANCPSPTTPTNGYYEPHLSLYKTGDQVKLYCKQNHFLDGPPVMECLQQGVWNSPFPMCKKECPLVVNPMNGTVNLPNGRLVEGVSLKYTCDNGYRLEGEGVRICQKDGSWTGDDPICKRNVVCEDLQKIDFGEFVIQYKDSSTDIYPGTSVNFTCNEGFALVGQDTILCGEDGVWSDEPPLCILKENVCRHPVPPKDGFITLHGKGGKHGVLQGTVIEYSCAPLHYLEGSKSATCLNTTRWSSRRPQCKKIVTCTLVDTLTNGKVEIYKSEVSSSDNAPRSRLGDLPVATGMGSRVGNGFLSAPRKGNGNTSKDSARTEMWQTELPENHYHVGTRAVYSCESRYYELIGSSVRSCMSNGLWSGRQSTCIPVCGRSSGPRRSSIVGGTPSEIGQWPWQVAIASAPGGDDPQGQWRIFCGGTLLSEMWVVTAAHCVTFKESKNLIPYSMLQLYFGKHYTDDSRDDQEVQIKKIDEVILHPDYEPEPSMDSDIALVLLSEPVRFTSRVQIVCLPEIEPEKSLLRLKEGNSGVVSGWGITETKNVSSELLYTEVPVVNSVQCQEDYRKARLAVTVTKNMICAGYETGKHDQCSGDSGGPLVFPLDERRDRWVLEGIVSWGSVLGCGNPGQHGVYTRVQRFIEWIYRYI